MGLTKHTTGTSAWDSGLPVLKRRPEDRVIALAGNPNVGKSTLFNGLTGMKQHTGNWPGKTVANAQGYCSTAAHDYVLVDIPGTYSLLAHSAEEEVARNFLCFSQPDAVIVVCDATCLERNLNLVLQILELSTQVIVCVNLMDEARRKGILLDLDRLSALLGVPVVSTVAQCKASQEALMQVVDQVMDGTLVCTPHLVTYPPEIEQALSLLAPELTPLAAGTAIQPRWLALNLLAPDAALFQTLQAQLGIDCLHALTLKAALTNAHIQLGQAGLAAKQVKDAIVTCLVTEAERISRQVVTYQRDGCHSVDRKLDRILTSKGTGYPVMLLLLALVFWITIAGANIPSQWLSTFLFWVEEQLHQLFVALHAPAWLHGLLVDGCFHVLAWVVSVMLPPMAIFFPLFSLLEDVGYLPRVAYNLDKPFQKCCACGKQALPYHRLPARAAAGHPDQQLRPLQRPLPHSHHPADPVLSRLRRWVVRLPPVRPAANPAHPAGAGGDLRRHQTAVPNRPEGRSLLLHPGAAALPKAPDRQGHRPVYLGSHPLCVGACGGSSGAGGDVAVGDG